MGGGGEVGAHLGRSGAGQRPGLGRAHRPLKVREPLLPGLPSSLPAVLARSQPRPHGAFSCSCTSAGVCAVCVRSGSFSTLGPEGFLCSDQSLSVICASIIVPPHINSSYIPSCYHFP